MMLAMLMYCSSLGAEYLCQNQREIFFSRGKPVGQEFLITISVVYGVWNSVEQQFDGVTGFLDN